ncbi:hypothetical protein CF392_16365 [Tamilnaduibacter salinus]|uniref:Uncharacterized protein n=1 Tax=Tamilnaduibacter salinus TaxID=1484056 RepID=A0A2A2HZV8_9GAMM|nr:hypothetical protein CF392_16365 [Tamilnaduibacter salinus]
MVIEAGQSYAGKVGKVFTNSSQGNGAATSWYRLEGASGEVTITVSDYVADGGGGGLGIEVFSGDADRDVPGDLNSLSKDAFSNPDGSASPLTLRFSRLGSVLFRSDHQPVLGFQASQ